MKHTCVVTLAICTCILMACNGDVKKDDAGTDSITSQDSLNALKDTAPKTIAATKEDAGFAIEAASGSLAEVELGKLALHNGENKRVKNFGAMMIKDHSKANVKLMALAKNKNITLPAKPSVADQQIIDKLSKKWGAEFDKAYIQDMIADHEDDIKAFENASKNGSDPDIKAFATKTLPMLKNHLDAINTIHDSMK